MKKKEIESVLAQRFQEVLIDEVTAISEKHAEGEYYLSPENSYIYEHYPERPIYPAVFMMEMCTQMIHVMVAANINNCVQNGEKIKVLYAKAGKVRFCRVVELGNTLKIEVDKKGEMDNMITCNVRLSLAGEDVFTAEMTMLVER